MREDIMAQCYSQIEAMLIEQSVIALPVLRAIGDSTAEGGAFGRLLNLRLLSPEPGTCRCAAEVDEHLWGLTGSLHRAILYALLDYALEGAVRSILEPGQAYDCLETQVRYLRPVQRGRLLAEARLLRWDGSQIRLYARVDWNGQDIATAESRYSLVPRT